MSEPAPPVEVGLERLAREPALAADWGRVGLLCNQASVTRDFVSAVDVLATLLGPRLTALFGPQHGFFGTVQDNMIETGHDVHPGTGLELFSLYSDTREPTDAMMAKLDTLVVDLQIVGCRIYTWKSTIAGCLRAAKRNKRRVVILDRPNPLGGEVLEGRVLDDDAHSFVGQFPTPMRHGLTAGEAARFFNAEIGADLTVVPLRHWDPRSYWRDGGRPWVLTSPNLPTIDPVYTYPGTVLFEATNVSEGRGTGLPFQFIGAPYVRSGADVITVVRKYLGEPGDPPGIHLREAQFMPTSQKWAGEACRGVCLHVTDPTRVRSFRLSLALCEAFLELGGAGFAWKDPPYEYDHVTLPLKLILGSQEADRHFGAGTFSCDEAFWKDGIAEYARKVLPYLLYPRTMRDET